MINVRKYVCEAVPILEHNENIFALKLSITSLMTGGKFVRDDPEEALSDEVHSNWTDPVRGCEVSTNHTI